MRKTLLLVVLLALALVAACGGGGYGTPAPTPRPTPIPAPAAGEVQVEMRGFAFNPASLTIDRGTRVTWTNRDSERHTATGPGFDSGNLAQGQSFSFVFTQAGTFNYHCNFHPSMTATITVR